MSKIGIAYRSIDRVVDADLLPRDHLFPRGSVDPDIRHCIRLLRSETILDLVQ